jgi:flagellum-specific ATP synthase
VSLLTRTPDLDVLIDAARPRWSGTVNSFDGASLSIAGLAGIGRLGDRLVVEGSGPTPLEAEIIGFDGPLLTAFAFGEAHGVAAGARVALNQHTATIRPSEAWLGSVIDWRGLRTDLSPPPQGDDEFPLTAPPPPARLRKRLGARMTTHHAIFDTFLPLCRGQRIGLFAGSGVGKSLLLASLVRRIEADVCVVGLIGERGREVRSFIEEALGEDGLARSIVVASTSDEPALAKRQCARLAMSTAEYFRARGQNVLLVLDSLTRYAEAHREIALAAGEPPSLHAFPPSTFNAIASLAERAGPGVDGEGDITAIFSVLVAGSDMDGPVADIVRGVLDGHVVLDRAIAERGRYPAINMRKSVSRSLPAAASMQENELLSRARALLSAYEEAELIIQAGLYAPGSDPRIDRAIKVFPALDKFFTEIGHETPEDRFIQLQNLLREDA